MGRRPSLSYVPVGDDPARRVPQLFVGLGLYGLSLSAMVRAALGVGPWSVLTEGLERHSSLSFGTVSAVIGGLVLLLWIPLKQRPTFGTFANIAVLACSSDLGLSLIPHGLSLPARIGMLAGGVVLNATATAIYVGARLGPGPRDGLMTGTAATTGLSIRLVRTLLELSVLAGGWALGGTVGVGTLLYAVSVGPVTQYLLPHVTYIPSRRRPPGVSPVHEMR